jgi:hypothetical protein
VARYEFDAPEWPDEFLFLGEGSATYPEGELEYTWEGIGSAGPVFQCLVTRDEIRMRPRKAFRVLLDWPQLVLPREDIRAAEVVLSGRYRFRSDNRLLDGACFRPVGSGPAFRAALDVLGIPVRRASMKEKLAFERRVIWNQMRPRKLRGRGAWKRDQHPA